MATIHRDRHHRAGSRGGRANRAQRGKQTDSGRPGRARTRRRARTRSTRYRAFVEAAPPSATPTAPLPGPLPGDLDGGGGYDAQQVAHSARRAEVVGRRLRHSAPREDRDPWRVHSGRGPSVRHYVRGLDRPTTPTVAIGGTPSAPISYSSRRADRSPARPVLTRGGTTGLDELLAAKAFPTASKSVLYTSARQDALRLPSPMDAYDGIAGILLYSYGGSNNTVLTRTQWSSTTSISSRTTAWPQRGYRTADIGGAAERSTTVRTHYPDTDHYVSEHLRRAPSTREPEGPLGTHHTMRTRARW
ncbi:hypothetical protein ACRAWF_12355 [Streptomyces sp. L7]